MEFLKVKRGDTVLVEDNEIATVLSYIGSARDPDIPSLFQVANIDTGEIHYVNANDVKEILASRKV